MLSPVIRPPLITPLYTFHSSPLCFTLSSSLFFLSLYLSFFKESNGFVKLYFDSRLTSFAFREVVYRAKGAFNRGFPSGSPRASEKSGHDCLIRSYSVCGCPVHFIDSTFVERSRSFSVLLRGQTNTSCPLCEPTRAIERAATVRMQLQHPSWSGIRRDGG